MAVVGVSLGLNVLDTERQTDVPGQLGALLLVGGIEGPEALAQVGRLHGTDIGLVSAYVAEYADGDERVTVWVGTAESEETAQELTRQMFRVIEKRSSGFRDPQQLIIGDREVFRIVGPAGEHFFYTSEKLGENVVWLTIEANDVLSILETALKIF